MTVLVGNKPLADMCIGGNAAPMKRLGILAYSTAIVGITLLTAREVIEPSVYLYQNHAAPMAALGVLGWFIATLCPLLLSIWFWHLARRSSRQWLLHLIFIPCAVAVYRLGANVLFFAADVPDGDSVEGYTLIVGFSFLVFTLLIHIAVLAVLGFKRIQQAR